MKKMIVGLAMTIMISLPAYGAETSVSLNDHYMLCSKKTDALAANFALGMRNGPVVKDYIKQDLCFYVSPNSKMKVRIIKAEKAPVGKGYATLLRVAVLKAHEKNYSGKDEFWMADILDTLKQ